MSAGSRFTAKKLAVPLAFVAALTPLAWLGVRYLRDDLTANPISEVLNQLGLLAVLSLIACLSCTPLKLIFGWKWPLLVRKTFGNFAFFFGCLHLSTYLGLDQFFDWRAIGNDILKHKFILLGMSAWLCLLPLAITSTKGWVKRLGFRRWKQLHRLVYLAGALGSLHFFLRFKTARPGTLIYAGALVVLLLVRVIDWRRRAVPAPSPVPGRSG